MYPRLTFVLGRAASGQSGCAEAFAVRNDKARVSLATTQMLDIEMGRKIDDSVARRGDTWTTIEAPDDLIQPLAALTSRQEVCLLDCSTMRLSNRMLSGGGDAGVARSAPLRDLSRCAADLVVSNETGQGMVPETRLARRFREALGLLNIAFAAQADLVVHVVAGPPQVLNGQMP